MLCKDNIGRKKAVMLTKLGFSIKHEIDMPFEDNYVPAWECSDNLLLNKDVAVSVVMLVYNHEDYIRNAVEGVLSQNTNFDYELIVGEDCYPDRCLNILLQYQKRYPQIVRVITHENNIGARLNAYRCEKLARGKYIAWCEGDDRWHDNGKLQLQYDYLEINPDCGLVYSNADTYHVLSGHHKKSAIPFRPELCDSDDPFVQILVGVRIIWPLSACVRKSLLDKVTSSCPEITDKRMPVGDEPRFLEISRLSQIEYLPISTATRNLLPESATQSRNQKKRIQYKYAVGEMTLYYLDKYPIAEKYDHMVRRWVHLRNIEYAYGICDFQKAKESFQQLKKLGISLPFKHILYLVGSMNQCLSIMVGFAFNWIASFTSTLRNR